MEKTKEERRLDGRHAFFPRVLVLFYRVWRSVSGRSRETCYVTEFSQPLILNCTPSSSIRGSLLSGGHVCHNLLGMVHSRCWRRGQKINKLDWAARPRGRSPYPGLCGSASSLLHQAPLFTALWAIKGNFTRRLQQKKGKKIYSIVNLNSTYSVIAPKTNMASHKVNGRTSVCFSLYIWVITLKSLTANRG